MIPPNPSPAVGHGHQTSRTAPARYRRRLLAAVASLAWLNGICATAPTQAQGPPEYPIIGLQFSPDGKYLAASSNSNEPPGPVVIWNVDDWTVHRLHRSTKGIIDVDFSPDGTQLAYAGKNERVGVLDVASGNLLREIEAKSGAVYSVAFTPDGKFLLSGGVEPPIKLWNLSTGELVRTFDDHAETVDSVAVSPDARTLLSGGNDRQARLWNFESGEVTKRFTPTGSIVRRVTFSRDGKFFLVSSWGGDVWIRETATARLRALLKGGSDCADITTDNRLVATSGWGTIAHVFVLNLHDPAPDEVERIALLIERFQDDSYDVRESAAEEIVRIGLPAEPQLRQAMNHEDAEVRVRARRLREKVLSPEPTAQLTGHLGDVEVVCFTADGRLLATACRGGSIMIRNAATWNELKSLTIAASETETSRK